MSKTLCKVIPPVGSIITCQCSNYENTHRVSRHINSKSFEINNQPSTPCPWREDNDHWYLVSTPKASNIPEEPI